MIARVLILCVRAYQVTLSPWLPPWCRYHPSCSSYMVDALTTHGPVRGLWMGIKRLSRCHPFGGSGFDPVPPREAEAKR